MSAINQWDHITNSRISDLIKLIISILICLFAGFLGSVFTTPAIPTWYAALTKPPFTPPGWLFFPVWTSLFIMMGISVYLIWQRGIENHQVRIALGIFAAQLILNVLWSAAFFGLRSPLAGLIDIFILWILIVITIMNFIKVSRIAGLLLIPYIM